MAGILDLLLGAQNSNDQSGGDPTANYLGNLIDPATAQQFAQARQQQGMLGLSAGLLAGSGPSRLPVPFGSALGAGLQGMMQAQNQLSPQALQAAQTQGAVTDAQFKKLQGVGLLQNMQLLRQQADALQKVYGGDASGGNAPSGAPGSVPGNLTQGSVSAPFQANGENGALSFGQLKGLATKYFPDDPDAANTAAAISYAESKGNPNAYNPNGENSYGLTQINADAWGPGAKAALGNPDAAFGWMRNIYDKAGGTFRDWSTYKNGDYKQYLPAVAKAQIEPLQMAGATAGPGSSSAGYAPQAGGTGSPFDLAEGDSIGVGFQKFGGLSGNAVGGRNPQAVLDNIQGNLQSDPNYYQGKTVLLSTGTMNDPAGKMTGLIPQQLQAIQGAGGKVVLAGADTGKFAPRNDQLAQIAQDAKIPFAGPLPTNNIHPGPDGYSSYIDSASRLAQPQQAQPINPASIAASSPGLAGALARVQALQAGGGPFTQQAPQAGPPQAGIAPQGGMPQAPQAGAGFAPQAGPPQAGMQYQPQPPTSQALPPGVTAAQINAAKLAAALASLQNRTVDPNTAKLSTYGVEAALAQQNAQAEAAAKANAALVHGYNQAYGTGAGGAPFDLVDVTVPTPNGPTPYTETKVPKQVALQGPQAVYAYVNGGQPGGQQQQPAQQQMPQPGMAPQAGPPQAGIAPQAGAGFAPQAGPPQAGIAPQAPQGAPMFPVAPLGGGARGLPAAVNPAAGGAASPVGAPNPVAGGIAPSAPNAAPGAPQGAPPIIGKPIQNPAYQSTIEGLSKEDSELVQKTYLPEAQKARDMIDTAQLIKDLLPQVRTGYGAQYQAAAAKIMSALGVDDKQVQDFLGTNPMAADILQKKFLEQSSLAVRQLGAREPGSVIQLFGKAYPGLTTQKNAIELMENVLTMQAKWAQDRLSAANDFRMQNIENLRQMKGYQPLSNFEAQFQNGPNGAQLYLKAAEAMSGIGDKAWQGLNRDQQAGVYAAIPAGQQYMRPDGKMDIKPNGR